MGKGISFLVFSWIIIGVLGSIMQGGGGVVGVRLTADITDAATTIPVTTTSGFTDSGLIDIGDERIAYGVTDATNFKQNVLNPMARGTEGTTAAVHKAGDTVYSVEASTINRSMNYTVATIADASGIMGFMSVGLALLRLMGNFTVIGFSFLGTEVALLGYIWMAISLGILVSVGIAIIGGRRV